MSLNKNTKAKLLGMLSSRGIDAKPSMKKDELIGLLEKAADSALGPIARAQGL